MLADHWLTPLDSPEPPRCLHCGRPLPPELLEPPVTWAFVLGLIVLTIGMLVIGYVLGAQLTGAS